MDTVELGKRQYNRMVFLTQTQDNMLEEVRKNAKAVLDMDCIVARLRDIKKQVGKQFWDMIPQDKKTEMEKQSQGPIFILNNPTSFNFGPIVFRLAVVYKEADDELTTNCNMKVMAEVNLSQSCEKLIEWQESHKEELNKFGIPLKND